MFEFHRSTNLAIYKLKKLFQVKNKIYLGNKRHAQNHRTRQLLVHAILPKYGFWGRILILYWSSSCLQNEFMLNSIYCRLIRNLAIIGIFYEYINPYPNIYIHVMYNVLCVYRSAADMYVLLLMCKKCVCSNMDHFVQWI